MLTLADAPAVPLRQVSLREAGAPTPPAAEAAARDELWALAAAANPALFDGPVTLLPEIAWESGGGLRLGWTRGTYRDFFLQRVPGATAWLPSLFVSVVQPTSDGRVVVGRMAGSTGAPDRWQLPGGTVEPPPAGAALTLDALRAHAALELAEEVGVDADPQALRLAGAITADRVNVGILFTAPPLDLASVADRFTRLHAAEALAGREPEFSEFVALPPLEIASLTPAVDYLAAVAALLAAGLRS